MARNIEDLAAEKITPLIPAKILSPMSMQRSASSASASWVSIVFEAAQVQKCLHLQSK